MDSQAPGRAELFVSYTLWQDVGKPLQNQRPQNGSPSASLHATKTKP